MKRALTMCSLAVAFASVAWPSFAGQIEGKIRAHGGDPATAGLRIQLDSDPASITLSPNASGWQFTLTNSEPTTRLRLRLNTVPAGYEFGEYDVDVPYYYQDRTIVLTALLIKEDNDDSHIQSVIDSLSGGTWLQDLPRTFDVSRRLQRIYRERQNRIENDGAAPLRIDVSVAYWVVVTARELFERRSIVPDDTAFKAADWLDHIMVEKPRLIGSRSAPADAIEEANRRLREWENVKYVRLISSLEDGLKSHNASKRLESCGRVRSLWTKVRILPEEDYARVTQAGAIHLRATTNTALCLAREASQKGPSLLEGSALELATALFDDFDKLIPSASGAELENAKGRRADLAKFVPTQ